MRAGRRLRAGLAAAFTFAAIGLVSGVSAAPAAAGPGCSGVTIAVDFAAFGGPLDVRCASTGTALQSLASAGFATAGTARWGSAFLCRLGADASTLYPTPYQDPCVNTPPASAYWAVSYATSAQSGWAMTPQGVTSFQAPPGSALGFAFGAGVYPGISPADLLGPPATVPAEAAPVAPAPDPATAAPQQAPDPVTPADPAGPTASTGAADQHTGQAGQPGEPPSSAPAGPPGGQTDAASGPAASTTGSPPSGGAAAASGSATAATASVSPVSARRHASPGSATPALVGAGLAVVIGAGAGGTALSRRHRAAR